MKRIMACLLALLLLLTACQPGPKTPLDSDGSNSSQQGGLQKPDDKDDTDQKPNDDTDDKTDKDEEQEVQLHLEVCLLTERKTLSYEEFFGEDRMYAYDGGHGRTDWVVPAEEEMKIFKVTRRMHSKEYYVTSYDDRGKYDIPGIDAYTKEYELFSADGVYVYFKNTKQIVQLDMRTGNTRQIVQCDYIADACICGRDALYYAAVKDGKLAVNRLYIPTMQLDVLYDDFPANTPVGPREFYLYTPKSTQGDVVWQTINPAMLAQMQKELENPNSKYRVAQQWQTDITSLWEKEDPWEQKGEADENEILRLTLCERIQKDTGIRAYLEGTYNQSSGSYTKRLGIIDSCWNGSGHPVDHYAPEITEKEDPVPAFGEWIHIPDVTPIQDEGGEAKAYSDQFMPYTLYRYEDGKLLEKLTDTPVISQFDTFCVTENNTLIQVSSDGNICNTLYNGKGPIRDLEQLKDKLYFLDGDNMIELDLSAAKYRTILEYTGIDSMQLDNSWDNLGDEYARIYFTVSEGSFFGGYIYNMAIGEIKWNGYRN